MKLFPVSQMQYLGEFTWANRPSASSSPKSIFYCTDLAGGIYLKSDGTKWTSLSNTTISLFQLATGWLVPGLITGNAATYTQSGTLVTVTSTAHNLTSSQNGKKVYLDFNSGAAADGWYTNFTYIDANSFSCTSSVSQTTSGGLNTNTSTIAVPDLAFTVPGGLLGTNGRLIIKADGGCNNSAGVKTTTFTIDGNTFLATPTTNITSGMELRVKNKNIVNLQTATPALNIPYGGTTTANRQLTINTVNDFALSFSLQVATASDWVTIESLSIEVLP